MMSRSELQEIQPMHIAKLTYGLYDTISSTLAAIISMPWYLKIVPLALTYFAPLKDTVNLILAAVFADLIFSIMRQIRSAKKARLKNLKKEHLPIVESLMIANKVFDGHRLFDSVVKMLAYIVLLMLFFSVDAIILKISLDEIDLMRFSFTNGLALILIGVEIRSILKHMGEITNNSVFAAIGKFTDFRIKKMTGLRNESQETE